MVMISKKWQWGSVSSDCIRMIQNGGAASEIYYDFIWTPEQIYTKVTLNYFSIMVWRDVTPYSQVDPTLSGAYEPKQLICIQEWDQIF
jgi:hypothetical protein